MEGTLAAFLLTRLLRAELLLPLFYLTVLTGAATVLGVLTHVARASTYLVKLGTILFSYGSTLVTN